MILAAALIAIFVGFFLLLGRNLLSLIVGVVILSNGINLIIFTMSQPSQGGEVFVGNAGVLNDPVPQALVLTAIVISFALLALVVAVAKSVRYQFEGDSLIPLNQEES